MSFPTHLDVPSFGLIPLSSLVYAGLGLGLAAWLWSYRDGTGLGNHRNRYRKDLFTAHTTFLLGNLPFIWRNRHRMLELFPEMYALMGPEDKGKFVSFSMPFGRRIIDITRPDLIEHVQKNNFSNYVKGKQFYLNMEQVLGDGIFSVDGHAWNTQRKATSKIFNGNAFRGIITQSLDKNLDRLVTIIKRHADKGEIFDLSNLFFRFTLESFGSMAFGTDIGALSTETDAPVPFASAFDYAQTVLDERFNDPIWRINEFFSGKARKMRETVKVLDDFSYGLIDERTRVGLNTFTSEKKDAGQTDLLSLYMSIRDDSGKPLTRKALRDAVLNLIIAGRDTTAQATSWTFYHLLKNPQWLKPIRAEIDEMGNLDYDTFKHMHATNATFNEGLRLHPSVPKNGWQALHDDQLPNGGPFVRAGEFVHWGDWMMARSEQVWGPDAKVFNPKRWIDEDGSCKKESQWKNHVFNGGYRLCLGQELARYEGAAMIATIIKNFDLEFAEGYLENTEMMTHEDTPRYLPSLTLHMGKPLLVRARVRNSA